MGCCSSISKKDLQESLKLIYSLIDEFEKADIEGKFKVEKNLNLLLLNKKNLSSEEKDALYFVLNKIHPIKE